MNNDIEQLQRQIKDLRDTLGKAYRYETPGKSYGSMYGDNISVTVTVASTGVYYQIGSGLSAGACSSDFTFQTGRELKCNRAGKFAVSFGVSLTVAAGNQHLEATVMVNGTAQAQTTMAGHSANSNDEETISGRGIITLALNDLVSLAASNETATNNITVTHLNLSIVRVE